MTTPESTPPTPAENKFSGPDVAAILRERKWQATELSADQSAWCERAAALLGPQSADRAVLENLLALVFYYDAQEILAQVETHVALSRYAAREALRELATHLLDPAPLTPPPFTEAIDPLKAH